MPKANVPATYVPAELSAADAKAQLAAVLASRAAYKKGEFAARAPVASFASKPSPHVAAALARYGVASIVPSRALAAASGCSLAGQRAIVAKGEGAFYSSGSRPNQSAQSWARARLASALTGGPASVVDLHILEEACKEGSAALRLARAAKAKKAKAKVA